jgi:GNAT superfamily N-acetyltransferase
VIVRPARSDDLTAIARISMANDEPVADPDRPGSRYLEHLLGHARLLVAETGAGVVGFAGAIDTPPGWFLTDLFVDPDAQGRGIGRALLAEALPASGPRLTFSSSDPRAMPLYIRNGLAPWWPLLYLRPPDAARSGQAEHAAAGGWSVEPLEPAAAAELERELTGHDRSRDWTLWGTRPGHVPFRVVERGRPIAVGVVAHARLVRLAIARDADPAGAVLAVLSLAPGGPPVGLAIPGPHPAARALLELGWRIEGQDTFMASGPDLLDPTLLLPDPSLA